MERSLDQPMKQSDFDYEKRLLRVVFNEVLFESACAIDAEFPFNRHSTEADVPFYTASWIDQRGYGCHLRTHTSIHPDTKPLPPKKWTLKTNFYFTYEMMDCEPRRLFYTNTKPYRVVPLDDMIGGIGADQDGEAMQNSDYTFACEILESLKQRPGRITQTESDYQQFQLFALDRAIESERIHSAIGNIDFYRKHLSDGAIDMIIGMVLRCEPMVDVKLVRKRILDEYYLQRTEEDVA